MRAAFFTPSPSFLHSSKSRRQALHRRAAEALVEAKSQPEAIAHHFTQAGLDDLAIEWWGKTGDEALHRSAFKEAISHLGKAIAMADKAGSTTRQANTGSAAPSGRLTQLHVAYGNALMAARGFAAPETTGAFAKARESAFGAGDAPGRLEADYGLWAGSYSRGDLPTIRAHAAAFLNDIEGTPDSPEAGVAHRAAGATCLSSPFPRSVFLVILEYVAATIAQPARVAVAFVGVTAVHRSARSELFRDVGLSFGAGCVAFSLVGRTGCVRRGSWMRSPRWPMLRRKRAEEGKMGGMGRRTSLFFTTYSLSLSFLEADG